MAVGTLTLKQAFVGDYPELNDKNTKGLVKLLSRLVEQLTDKTKLTFYNMYHNDFTQPLITHHMMQSVDWDNVIENIDSALDEGKG